ncbi:MAG: hypothetical protein Q8O53_01940 [Candidatus Moranbacteria bacterium]|nr:hypothetical protein [Candidatus Moranbacteria bacterium]
MEYLEPWFQLITAAFLFGTLHLSQLAANWAGMSLEEAEEALAEFQDSNPSRGDFGPCYPAPRLQQRLDQDGQVHSTLVGVTLFVFNLALWAALGLAVSDPAALATSYGAVLLMEYLVLQPWQLYRRRRCIKDLTRCVEFRRAESRIVGRLTPLSSEGATDDPQTKGCIVLVWVLLVGERWEHLVPMWLPRSQYERFREEMEDVESHQRVSVFFRRCEETPDLPDGVQLEICEVLAVEKPQNTPWELRAVEYYLRPQPALVTDQEVAEVVYRIFGTIKSL